MKKTIFLLLLFFAIKSYAQTNSNDTAFAEMQFDKLSHDFGIVKKGDTAICYFTLTNIGKAPLILTSVSSSCSCVTPIWTREPIASQQSTVIEIRYDTDRPGSMNKRIQVYSNAKNSPVFLYLKGNVVE